VTILAVLALIGGVFAVLAGLAAVGLGGITAGVIGGSTGAAAGTFVVLVGILALVGGAFYLAFAYGAWTLKPWGWAIGVIGALWGIVTTILGPIVNGSPSDLISFGTLIGLAVPAGILYYLNQPHVKQAFGRA
jgi:hypothetical protein